MAGKKAETINGFLSAEELAAKKGLKPSFIKNAVKRYGLPAYKLGRLLRFKESEFDLWVEQRNRAS